MIKVPLHCSFWPKFHELWSKEGVGVKLGIANLTPNYKPLENKGQMGFDWGMLYIVGKIFESYEIVPLNFQNKFVLRKIQASKVLKQQESQIWDSHLEVLGKSDIWM